MNTNSNAYTLIFTAIMVIVVSVLLVSVKMGTQDRQKANVKKEKMQNILSSVGITVSPDQAQSAFDKYIVEQIVIDAKGQLKNSEIKAFDVDVLKEYKSGLNSLYKNLNSDPSALTNALLEKNANYPLFKCKTDDGKLNYIIPLIGQGLWGPIWGYVALGEDKNTVTGTSFDHKTETPGLGAEIKETFFEEQWIGKQIFDGSGTFKSIKVVKGGAGSSNLHGVDAISGGTITSNGVSEMVERTLKIYEPFLKAS